MKSFWVAEEGGLYQKFPVVFSAFPDRDTHCIIQQSEKCVGKSILVFHSLYPRQNDRLVQLFLMLETLKSAGATKIAVFSPYLPYSRQDKQHMPGEAVSIDIICQLLREAGCDILYTLDCHFMKQEPLATRGNLKVRNISLGPLLIERVQCLIGDDKFDIIAPDEGASYLAGESDNKYMRKKRGTYGDLSRTESYRHIEEYHHDHIRHDHQKVLIIDDMVSTGSTIFRAIESLHSKGITDIYCATTHGFFLRNSLSKLAAKTNGVVYSDSIRTKGATLRSKDIFWDTVAPDWFQGYSGRHT